MQAIQINIDAATPNVSLSATSPRAVRVDQSEVLQKHGEGWHCQGEMLQGLLADWELAQANLCMVPWELWGSLS